MPNELNTTPENTIAAPDLTKRPPRSPRCRLGGYVVLPRMLNKGRATIAAQVAAGLGDGEILAWLNENAVQKRTPWEIAQWSEHMLRRGPDSDEETLIFFFRRVGSFSKTREDIHTWMDLLDLDDFVAFGGKP